MAVSNSFNFTRTAGQVIKDALRKCGLVAEGEEPSSGQLADGLVDLNLLVKSWPANGIDLWRYEELTVFTVVDKQSYNIGATGNEATFDAFKTEMATAAANGASTITVDSAKDITNGDFIGIELDNGTLQWTTVNGVPAANVVTLTNVLTDSAGIDNHVYNYTTIAQRPMRLYDGRLLQDNANEIPIVQISRGSYKALPIKDSSGSTSQFYYDPQLDNGKLFIWPTSDSVKDRLLFSAQRQLQDLDISTDNLDFPQEWLKAIIWNLAVDMAFDYNLPTIEPQFFQSLERRAAQYLEDVENFDVENVSINFMPSDEDVEGWE